MRCYTIFTVFGCKYRHVNCSRWFPRHIKNSESYQYIRVMMKKWFKIIDPFLFSTSSSKFMKKSHRLIFLPINGIWYDKQFGFRKGLATNHAIITLVDKVTRAFDTGKVVVAVYLDLRKAFDTVPHTILLHLYCLYGVFSSFQCKMFWPLSY